MSEHRAQTPIPIPKRSVARRVQDGLARLFDVGPTERTATVAGMLARGSRLSAGYWLQLSLAIGIATLGLLLGSTAVVIGAMLVSPLMGPIIELGMGLAVGSPLLVVRTALRLVFSIVVVALSAAGLTVAAPIHEVTSEIAARTTPNLLDLAIAAFCALAGVYASIRSGTETTSTAAGTAIGIALVPPLCVVGFGLGTGSASIAGGAALLFTANFCAILLLSVLAFVVLGFGSVDVAGLEQAQRDANEPGFVRSAARRLSAFFASKLGPAVRIAMPLVFVAAVFVPLRSALREVTWEVKARNATREALRDIQPDTIEVSVRVEQHRVYVRLITVDTGTSAAQLRSRLVERVDAAVGVKPDVEIIAVSDADALARAQASLRERPTPALPVVAPPREPFDRARREVAAALDSWPAESVGALAGWTLSMTSRGALRIELLHVGTELGRPASEIMTADLAARLGTKLVVDDVVLSAEPVLGAAAPGRAYAAAALLRRFPEADVRACVVAPAAFVGELASIGDARFVVRPGPKWTLRWSTARCDEADGGAAHEGDARAEEASDGGS